MALLLKMASFLGCGSVFLVLFVCFRELERLSKQPFRRELANVIQSSSIFTIGTMLPGFFISAFDAIFTANLWSRRGFFRSCVASVITVTILLVFWYSSIPGEWHVSVARCDAPNTPNKSIWFVVAIRQVDPQAGNIEMDRHCKFNLIPPTNKPMSNNSVTSYAAVQLHRLDTFVLLPFIYNLFADFLALILTRCMLSHLSTRPSVTIDRLITVLILSTGVLLILAAVFLNIAVTIEDYITHIPLGVEITQTQESIRSPQNFIGAILFPFYKSYSALIGEWSTTTLFCVFVWSTLMGIFWLLLFSTSVIIANLSVRLRRVGPWLDKYFRVRSQPFRILAFLAIIPVSVACVIYHMLF